MNITATSPGTDAGGGGSSAAEDTTIDTLDADLDAMRRAEELDDAGPDPDRSQAAPTEGSKAKASESAAKPGEKPGDKPGEKADGELTVDELRERHRQKTAALREERTARQSGEARIAALEAEINNLKSGKSKPADAGADQDGDDGEFDLDSFEIPDPNEDPRGAFLAMTRVATALLEERRTGARQQTEQQSQMTALQNLQVQFSSAEQEYAKVQPDYYDAVKHLREARMAELEMFGVKGPAAQQTFKREILQLVTAAMNTQDHPAHVIYEMSKRRGFAGGTSPPPPPPPPPAIDPAQAAADMKKRADASTLARTLSGAGGKPSVSGPTVEAANAIEDGDEFDRAFEELRRASKGR